MAVIYGPKTSTNSDQNKATESNVVDKKLTLTDDNTHMHMNTHIEYA